MIRAAYLLFASAGGAFACDDTGVPLVSDVVGAPAAFVAVEEVPLAQPFSVRVTVCAPATAGNVRVDAIMPAHQHGMNYTPDVTDLGGNAFAIDGLLFHMPGHWEMRVAIDINSQSVPYTHSIILK